MNTTENHDPFALGGEQRDRTALRERAEALAAEYDAPLAEGDAGLIEAEQRLHKLEPRRFALREAGDILADQEKAKGGRRLEIEAEIHDPPFNALCRLEEKIATTPAATLAGAAVKLRRLLDPDMGIEIGPGENDLPCLHQILAVIEREARP